ncbi:hypothetical protein [Dyadobacter sp. 676]|uniref:VCBS repeat-containing protein n=1 Tax=Dyadobacter sp. 676 TaxID=3088362 RepID=A0AAU8FFZ5_9BACT
MKIVYEKKIPRRNIRRVLLGCITLALLFAGGLWLTPAPERARYLSAPFRRSEDSARVSCGGLTLVLSESKDRCLNIQIARNGKYVSRFRDSTIRLAHCPDSVQIADINGDKQPDAKLTFGQADDHPGVVAMKQVYLISGQSYSIYSWVDFSNYLETDFNGDHAFELICTDSTIFNNQPYYKTEIYAFSGDKLTNVSLVYGYPKLTRIDKSPALIHPILTESDRRRLLSDRPRQFKFR